MVTPLLDSLRKFKEREGRALRVVLVNTGGTFSCLTNGSGLLAPIKNKKELEQVLRKGLHLDIFIEKGLLEVEISHLYSMDSSQMEDSHREGIVDHLHSGYDYFDGAVVIHGTDTATETAKFLHLAFPYFDPRYFWKDEGWVKNWAKPIIVLSSQLPAVDITEGGELGHRIDSDGPMNLSLALMLLSDGRVGEAGIVTNNGEALRGTFSFKGAEVDIPVFRVDPGAQALAKYTALGMRYSSAGFLEKTVATTVPFCVQNSSEFHQRICTVYDSSHLHHMQAILESKNSVRGVLKKFLPEIFIYVSKGAGNVLQSDYQLLKKAEEEGILTFRVPLPGGRIPEKQIYDVPGHDILALNMQPQTAKYKAMMTLKLAEHLNIHASERRIFIEKMMKTPWANEFLPRR